MQESQDFYNDGFGWICKHCERELKNNDLRSPKKSRLMQEGEAENKNPQLSTQALAKWADFSERTLVCPRCFISEKIYL
jgi:hypothetical protein